MVKNIFILVLGTLLLVNCNGPVKVNPITADNPAAKDSCCSKDKAIANASVSETSEITCPKCGHKKVETLPADVCVIRYVCENCQAELTPKVGDCCVFCTYGTHKCPSKQEGAPGNNSKSGK